MEISILLFQVSYVFHARNCMKNLMDRTYFHQQFWRNSTLIDRDERHVEMNLGNINMLNGSQVVISS